MAKSIAKLNVSSKFHIDQLRAQPLFSTNPEAALPLLSMIGQAQLSIDDLLGQLSRQFIEQLLVLSAQSVAGSQHKGRHTGEVRWHGSQSGVVRLGQSKMHVKRPRLRTASGEVSVPAYAALANDGELPELLTAFANQKERYSTDELLKLMRDNVLQHVHPTISGYTSPVQSREVAQFLFEIGFLSARQDHPDGSYEHATFADQPDLLDSRVNLDQGWSWEIHPVFRQTLNLRSV